MKAIVENDYSAERFTDIELLQQKLFDYNDTLVNCSYISFADFNLWDAWRRIWILGSFMRQAKAGIKNKLKIEAGKGKELFTLNSNNLDSLTPSFEGLGDEFFQNATTIVENVSEGLLSTNEAVTHIMGLINSIDFVPNDYYKLGDLSQKDIDGESDFIASENKRFMFWVKSSQKPEIKKYFDYDIEDLLALANLNAAKR